MSEAKERRFTEIEHVLYDYQPMKVNLEYLGEAEESYDFSPDKVRVSGGDMTSRVEQLAVKRADYRKCIGVVDAILAILPGDERTFISMRYFQGLPMEVVAAELHCDVRTAYNMKRRVLGKFAVALGWGKRHPAFERPAEVQGTLFSA